MKKILLVFIILFMLVLSGCATAEEMTNAELLEQWEREDRLEFIDGLRDCYDSNWDEDYCYETDDARYYTKEEIDDLLSELDTTKHVCVFPTATYIVVEYEITDEYVYMTDVNGTEYYQLASLDYECINFEYYVIRELEER